MLPLLPKAESKAALKEAKNAGVHGHYGPSGGGGVARGRGAEVALQYGGDVVQGTGKSGGGGVASGSRGKRAGIGDKEEQDEDEAQLDPEILALIEKEVGGGGGGGEGTIGETFL